jgi:DNA-binding response OmpR family regulator
VGMEQAIKSLAKRKVVLAEANARYRGEMARYLKSVGLEVFEASTATEAMDAIRSAVPHIVTVDIDLPGDIARTIRVAAEVRNGAQPRILLTCRPRTLKSRLAAMISPVVSAVVLTPCRPEVMIDRLARLADTLARTSDSTPVAKPRTEGIEAVHGNNSLLAQHLLCPFHERETPVLRHILRVNRVEVDTSFFDVPIYTRAVAGADYIDYNRLCVTVCPECLFASADPGLFLSSHNAEGVGTRARGLSNSARYAVMSRTQQRRDLVGALPPSFFTETRSAEDAVRAYELALHSSSMLFNVAPHLVPEEPMRQGNYLLRMSQLLAPNPRDAAVRDHNIAKAAKCLREAFSTLTESGVPRTVYQVVATSVYLGDDREAQQYLQQLTRLSRKIQDPAVKTLVDKYLPRCARAWEDRDQHRKPTPPPEAAQAPFLSAA